MESHLRTKEQALKTINTILDQSYGHFIDQMVTTTGDETLRLKLKSLLFELNLFQLRINQANDLNALELAVDESEAALKGRILSFERELELASERKRNLIRKEYEAHKRQALQVFEGLEMSDSGDEDQTFKDVLDLAKATENKMLRLLEDMVSTHDLVQDVILKSDRKQLRKDLARFRRWRIMRKWLRRTYDFFWGALILTFAAGLVFSEGAKWLILNPTLLILTLIVGAIVRYYWINPWYRNHSLERQRTHLSKSLHDFYRANIQVNIFLSLKQRTLGCEEAPTATR